MEQVKKRRDEASAPAEAAEPRARDRAPSAARLDVPSARIVAPLAGAGRAPEELLRAIFACDEQLALRTLDRRATFVWPGDEGVVVKRYERGVWRDAWRDWRERGEVRSPGRREAENLDELARIGVPTPRALGWCGSDGWRGIERPSAMWMERVEHRSSLREELSADPSVATRRAEELARFTATMHLAGWRHRDFYTQHWLVSARGLVLIDCGRCERERGMRERWFVKDVAALEMSCPKSVGARPRLRFLARYLRLRGVRDRDAKRDFARAVIAKARRMDAHQPRYADLRPAAARGGAST